MTNTEALVRIQNQLSEPFTITKGLKQGDGLAPTLFNIALYYVIRKMSVSGSGTLLNKTTQIAAYADDINIMSRTLPAVKEAYMELKNHAKEIGLSVNVEKTKMPNQTRRNTLQQNVTIQNDDIEIVETFTYLGVELTRDGREDREIRKRIMLDNKVYFSLSSILKSKEIH